MAYREGGSFTHEGNRYELDCVLALLDDLPILEFMVDNLAWVLDEMPAGYFEDAYEKTRVLKADLLTPIVVTYSVYGFVVLDGIHRLKKAFDSGQKTLPGKFILESELEKCIYNSCLDWPLPRLTCHTCSMRLQRWRLRL